MFGISLSIRLRFLRSRLEPPDLPIPLILLQGAYSRQNDNLPFGYIATVSFYPAHHITTGEGVAVLTDKPALKSIIDSHVFWIGVFPALTPAMLDHIVQTMTIFVASAKSGPPSCSLSSRIS